MNFLRIWVVRLVTTLLILLMSLQNIVVVSADVAETHNAEREIDYVSEAWSLPGAVRYKAKNYVDICGKVIWDAYRLSSTFVGTVEYAEDGTIQHHPEPRDRFRVKRPNQETLDIRLQEFRGTDYSNAENFLRSDHTIRCAITGSNYANFTVASTQTRGKKLVQIKGRLDIHNSWFFVILSVSSEFYRESGFGGFEYRDSIDISGVLISPDISISVDENHSNETIAHRGTSASTEKQTINSTWKTKDAEFQFQDIIRFRGYKDGRLNSMSTSGNILRNERPWGTVKGTDTGLRFEERVHVSDESVLLSTYRY